MDFRLLSLSSFLKKYRGVVFNSIVMISNYRYKNSLCRAKAIVICVLSSFKKKENESIFLNHVHRRRSAYDVL